MWQAWAQGYGLLASHAPWLVLVVAMLLGAVWGSFLNCALDRWSRRQSLRHPPSCCDSCQTRLTWPDLVPIASWCALGGKCRHCGAQVPARNTWLELGTTLWPAVVLLGAGLSPSNLFVILLGWGLSLAIVAVVARR